MEEGGADLNASDQDNEGRTPLYTTSINVYLEVVKWLVQVGKEEVDKATNGGKTSL